MTRTEFIHHYADSMGLSSEWAELGFVDFGKGYVRVALPCACGDSSCKGWAMLSAESVLHHLAFNAPQDLIAVYRKYIVGLVA